MKLGVPVHIDERRKQQLQLIPEQNHWREVARKDRNLGPPFPCLVCGAPIDSYTIQCEGCGYVYLVNELVCAEGVAAMRANGATEEEVAATARVMYGWMFDNPALYEKLCQHRVDHQLTPLMQAVFAQQQAGEKTRSH